MARAARERREHLEAVLADARSDLEQLSVYLDGMRDPSQAEQDRWAEASALIKHLGW